MGRASHKKWAQRLERMAEKMEQAHLSPQALASNWAGFGMQVIGMGLGAWLGPEAGLAVACLGLFFFIPSLMEFARRKGWTILGQRRVLVALLAIIGLGIFIFQHLNSNVPEEKTRGNDQQTTIDDKEQTPAILVRFLDGSLPIAMQPRSVTYVLQLNPNIDRWVWEIPNDGGKSIWWPQDLNLKQNEALRDGVYICEITNHGGKTLLDVSIPFSVNFYKPEEVPSKLTKNKDGTMSMSVEHPGGDHITVARNHLGKVTAVTDGELVKSFIHSASIPAIPAGKTERIYFVNQSKLVSKFTLPNEATAVLPDTAARVHVKLIRPQVNVNDKVPWFGLGPSTYRWPGVPGSP